MDPFGELDRMIETDLLKKKRDAFLALLDKPGKTEADLAAIRAARKDPFLEAVFLFRDYYDLKKKGEGSLSSVQMSQLQTMETKYPQIVRTYNNAKLKSMLMPLAPEVSDAERRVGKYGVATREDVFAVAQGKGRRRTGRGRRGRGRRRHTRRR